MYIHREGIPTISIAAMFLLAVNFIIRWSMPEAKWLQVLVFVTSLVLMYLIIHFFRNPKRKIIQNENHILAPADGKIVAIEETLETEYFNSHKFVISIFMSPLNVHVNRIPCSGKITYLRYHPGKYWVAWHPKSSLENERTTIVIKKENGTELLLRQIAGALARRIVWYVKENQNVIQGNELGFIKFGSRVDIFPPLHAKIKVNLGDKCIGGETILAEIQ
jgi:phosphatidylserine decarboxylase